MDNKKDNFFLPQKKEKHNIFHNKQAEKQQRQDDFDKNRKGVNEENGQENTKKPFDKKAYRLKKYSKKYKLEQWEEQRKKRLMHKYQKELKNDPVFGSYKPKPFDNDTIDTTSSVGKFVRHPDLITDQIQSVDTTDSGPKHKTPFAKAKKQFAKVKESKLEKQQAIQKAKEESMKKLQEYKRKKQERFKKLSKKTKKGQPVMTGRLEMLLEKLQKSK